MQKPERKRGFGLLSFLLTTWTLAATSADQETVVPIVLTASGLNSSAFTSELTLTNRGTTDAAVELTYTSAFGGGSGVARDTLPAGRQKIVPNAIDYLGSLGVPVPAAGNRGGTLRVRFSGVTPSSAGAATVRTTTAVPSGRAGLSYPGVAPSLLTGPVYLCGLRQTAADRSNLALVNLGSPVDGNAVLRVTVFSGDPAAIPLAAAFRPDGPRVGAPGAAAPRSTVLPDFTLAAGAFTQIDGVLGSHGLSLTNGYARVERVGGTAPWYAYAVINDQANSDGAFVPPTLASSLEGRSGITLPAAVEAGPFATELVITNFGAAPRTVSLTYVATAIQAPDGSASLPLTLAAGEQRVVPAFVQALRDHGAPGIGPAGGATYAGAVFLSVPGSDVSGLFIGARTSAPGGGGRYGLFYAGVPFGSAASDEAWLHGLQQNAENRTNLAIVNTGERDGSASTFRVDLFDGATGALVGTVSDLTLAARGWTQLGSILAPYAGTSSGYARVTRTAGTNPFLCYAVVNDGGAPGQRSDDGAYVGMDVAAEPAGIAIGLERVFPGSSTISFGLPLAPGAVSDTARIRVRIGGQPVDANLRPLLHDYDRNGEPTGLRAVLVQLPASLMPGPTLALDVTLDGGGSLPPAAAVPFASVSAVSPETAPVVDRTIVRDGSTYRLQESNARRLTLFTGREPSVIAHYPAGYLARTGFLGPQASAAEVAADVDRAGLRYLSDALTPFVRSSYYEEAYALNPDAGSVVDPVVNFEGWLYDRCATLLTAYSHVGDPAMLRHALRACSYYGSKITLDGPNRGIFTGKPDPDTKYSHLRGLYAYYALTGDEGALASGRAIADLWITDPLAIGPYRQGHLRGPDKLWTERLLGTGLEGLYYGFRLTGDKAYLAAFQQVVDTAYRHIATTDPAELTAINLDPNVPPFPSQNCFIHTALQHDEGDSDEPWCSAWMSELVLDSLLAYQAQTDDPRVDEIFVRLARFLRDVGSSYFQGDPLRDTFLSPAVCYDPSRGPDTRILIPLYGAGLFPNGTRGNYGQYDDFEHCTDATALTAAGLRALARQGKLDQGGPIGPFPTEGASLLQLQHEFAFCSQQTFAYWRRARRDPAAWTSEQLAAGAADPAGFILANKIGFPSHPSTPQRKLSWWFNTSMLQFQLLRDAGIAIPRLQPGAVQPAGRECPP